MKKLLSLILALCMACMLVPALAADPVEGDWYAKTITMGEQSLNVAEMGMTMLMNLAADGTATMTVGGEPQVGSWKVDGDKYILTFDGDNMPTTLEGEELHLVSETQGNILFTREAPVAVEFAEVNTEAKMEDFNGTWGAKYISMGGVTLNEQAAQAAGQPLPQITVDNGQIAFTEGAESITQMFGESLKLEYAEGILSYNMDIAEGMAITVTASLLQDGMLALKIGIAGEEMGMYFIPVEVPAE